MLFELRARAERLVCHLAALHHRVRVGSDGAEAREGRGSESLVAVASQRRERFLEQILRRGVGEPERREGPGVADRRAREQLGAPRTPRMGRGSREGAPRLLSIAASNLACTPAKGARCTSATDRPGRSVRAAVGIARSDEPRLRRRARDLRVRRRPACR